MLFAGLLLAWAVVGSWSTLDMTWTLVPFFVAIALTSRSVVAQPVSTGGDWDWTTALAFALTSFLAFGAVEAALIVAGGALVAAILDLSRAGVRRQLTHLSRTARSVIGILAGGLLVGFTTSRSMTLSGDDDLTTFVPFLAGYLLIQIVVLTMQARSDTPTWDTFPPPRLVRSGWPPIVVAIVWDAVSVSIAASLALVIDTLGLRLDYWVACIIAFVLLAGLNRLLQLNSLLRDRNVELAEAMNELRTLNAVGHVLNATIDPDRLCIELAFQLRRLTRADAIVIALIDPARTRVRIAYYAYGGVRQPERFEEMPEPSVGPPVVGGAPAVRSEQDRVPGDGIVSQVLAARRAVVGTDTERFALVRPDGTLLPEERAGVRHFHSAVGVPLQVAGDLIGAIALKSHQPDAFDRGLVALLGRIANQAALAMRNAEIIASERAANRAKQDFLSVVSHELRTPITSISGYSQLLSRRLIREAGAENAGDDRNDRGSRPAASLGPGVPATRPLASYLEMTEVISEQSRHLGRLVDDLVTLSGLGQGTMRFQMEAIDLAGVVEQAVAGARLSMDDPDCLRLETADGLMVIGDRRRLRAVLDNLIGNAITHGPAGTAIEVWLGTRNAAAEIRVTDHGNGIAMAVQAHVFEPFFRGADEEDELKRGLGLGLSISQEIVTAHGGTISVLSDEGAGATFIVRLQLANQPDAAAVPSQESGTQAGDQP